MVESGLGVSFRGAGSLGLRRGACWFGLLFGVFLPFCLFLFFFFFFSVGAFSDGRARSSASIVPLFYPPRRCADPSSRLGNSFFSAESGPVPFFTKESYCSYPSPPFFFFLSGIFLFLLRCGGSLFFWSARLQPADMLTPAFLHAPGLEVVPPQGPRTGFATKSLPLVPPFPSRYFLSPGRHRLLCDHSSLPPPAEGLRHPPA